ncbi:winged helix-turn-helix transcriptional regulator [Allokutzneria oryzae]|uniref:Winged helix-turn-helix transcriptional regulator n=1 Tax=Allokutzneria oryzae TaxID=1378989 RepID=A0ABV6A1B1_9PSEU
MRPSAIGRALLALGDQWALLILQRAFLLHTRRFADWRDELGISESVLAGRLRELVAGGLLEAVPYRDHGRTRQEYRLTERALELWPFLVSVWSWERQWVKRTHPLPELLHHECGDRVDVELGCAECGKAPVTARDTDTERGAEAVSHTATPRLHRRTVRAGTERDAVSYCPETLEILGDRWSTVLLAAAFLRVRRFAEFQSELGVAPSILSDRLRRFTELGVLEQVEVPGARHEYRLSAKGLAFFPVFAFLVDWAQRWHPEDPAEVVITHRACGGRLLPFLRCAACHAPVSRTGIAFT